MNETLFDDPQYDIRLAEFAGMPKIARLTRIMCVTEKIDGTNAQVAVFKSGEVRAGSKNRWVTPAQDNFCFASWVMEHEEQLRRLGPGRHFGEWWGHGIQRGYGCKTGERYFSLFNVVRYTLGTPNKPAETPPACCLVVPILYLGLFQTSQIECVLDELGKSGSKAKPGYANPEGIVVCHLPSRALFKKTFEGDFAGKGVDA
jgi:hypothetical protein